MALVNNNGKNGNKNNNKDNTITGAMLHQE